MSKSNTFENDLLLLVFNNTNISLIGDATGLRGSTAAGSLYVALHTADPGEAGVQNTTEATYTGYARVAVARAGGSWAVSGSAPTQVVPVAAISFGACTAGTNTITHFSIGTDVSGTGKVLYRGTVTPNITVTTGVTPQLTTASTITED